MAWRLHSWLKCIHQAQIMRQSNFGQNNSMAKSFQIILPSNHLAERFSIGLPLIVLH
jgi:hypothetical protein